jgi:hypothetical protein
VLYFALAKVMFVCKEVVAKERVMNQGLQDDIEVTRLTQVDQATPTYTSISIYQVYSQRISPWHDRAVKPSIAALSFS